MKKLTLTLFLALICSICTAQIARIDSLKHELVIAKQDTNRVKIGIDLCFNYWGINSDSSFKYGQQALDLSKKIKYYDGESWSLYALVLIIGI